MHLAFYSCFESIYETCLSPSVSKNSKAYYKSKANEFTYIHQNIFLQSEEHQKSLLNLENIYHNKLSDQLIILNKASVQGTHTFETQYWKHDSREHLNSPSKKMSCQTKNSQLVQILRDDRTEMSYPCAGLSFKFTLKITSFHLIKSKRTNLTLTVLGVHTRWFMRHMAKDYNYMAGMCSQSLLGCNKHYSKQFLDNWPLWSYYIC